MIADFEEIVGCYLSDDEFQDLEKAMLDAKRTRPKVFKMPALRPGMPDAEEIEATLGLCQAAFDNGEHSTMTEVYQALLDAGITWLPYFQGRMALGYAFGSQIVPAYHTAKEAYKTYPAEGEAYLAMAHIMKFADSPRQALKWLDLAIKALDSKPYYVKKLEKELQGLVEQATSLAGRIIPSLLKPSVVDILAKDPTTGAYASSDGFKDVLAGIKENPTIETIMRLRDQNSDFRLLFVRFFSVASLASIDPVVSMSESDLIASQRESGGSFANLSLEAIANIADHLSVSDIANLQQTCKPLFLRFNDESVWHHIYTSTFMGDTTGLHETGVLQDWKSLVKNMKCCLEMMGAITKIHAEREGLKQELVTFEESFQLTNIMKLYQNVPGVFGAPVMLWATNLLDAIVVDASKQLATFWAHALVPLWNALIMPNDAGEVLTASVPLQLMSSLVLASPDHAGVLAKLTGLPQALAIFWRGEAHLEAAATIGAVHACEYLGQFRTRVLVPGKLSRVIVSRPAADYALSGLYHSFMSWGAAQLYGTHEYGVINLVVEADGKIHGHGVDTLGKFTLEHLPDAVLELNEGSVQWLQKYKDLTLRFEGSIHPYGFGGTFGEYDPTCGPEDVPNFLGTWFISADIVTSPGALWDSHVARINKEASKRKIQKPWAIEVSNITELQAAIGNISNQAGLLMSPAASTQALMITSRAFQLPPPDAGVAEFFPLFLQGPAETAEKFEARKELCNSLFILYLQSRLEFFSLHKNKLRSDAAIISNPQHPKNIETILWWVYHLAITFKNPLVVPENLAHEMTEAATLIEQGRLSGAIGDETAEIDDDTQDVFSGTLHSHKARKSGGISTATFVAISSVSIAIVAIGAFFIGRALGSRKQ